MNAPAQPVLPSILIVEDERLVALDLKMTLQQLGYCVPAVVATGADAVAAARNVQLDLILMDIQLQGPMDGVETAAMIRQTTDAPIIFLTAHTDPATRARVRDLAPYGYLIKPFDERLLEVTLEMGLARHVAEQRTRASEQWLSTVLASLGDAVVATDTAGRIMMLNPVAEQLLGVNAAAAVGRLVTTVMDLRHPDTGERLPNPIQAVLAGAGSPTLAPSTVLRRPDGSGCLIDDSLALIKATGQTLGVVMVFRDSTQRQLAEHAREVELQRQEEARQRERLKVLAGGIAHDLNNMLTSVVGNIDLALVELPSEHAARELIAQAAAGGLRAAELTRQLLVYAGRAQPQWAPLNLAALVAEVVALLPAQSQRQGAVQLSFARTPLLVNGDVAQLRQVVMNLLINAVEALPPDDGSVRIDLERVTTADVPVGVSLPPALPAGTYARLTVTDSGCGMDEATLARIFDPFFTTKFTGRGLGLALVQGIIHDHSGAITVRSSAGQGTVFSVWLPALATQAQAPFPGAGEERWRGAGTVLLIDDEDALRAVSGRMLQQLGFQVLVAPDGPSGLRLFAEQRHQITCVLIDVTMPGMPGTTVAQELRRLAPELPLLLMSGYSQEEEALTVLTDSLQIGFLPKPFSLSSMRNRLQQVLAYGQKQNGMAQGS